MLVVRRVHKPAAVEKYSTSDSYVLGTILDTDKEQLSLVYVFTILYFLYFLVLFLLIIKMFLVKQYAVLPQQ